MMNETYNEDTPMKFTLMDKRQFGQILLLGAISGLLVWGLSFLLDTYIFHAVLCQAGSAECSTTGQYSMITASVITAILTLLALVRVGVFRPLLVVLAVTISLWSLVETLWGSAWYVGAILSIVLYALAYGTYSWIARIQNFWLSLAISVLLLIAIRFVITS
jgi:hypothetical protein